ncbi:beta strand repeat-containing protein, partial [Shewanella frigidimarina]|uniref:beta strand repeat-containing protein n=4 Tax=Shewanella frigidimarina TaxID=56812 RepID=UPI003F9F6EE7
MGSITTSKNGILSASESSVTITINNETKELQLGQVVPAGAIVASSNNLGFVITFDDGTIFNSANIPNDESINTLADNLDDTIVAQVADQQALDEIEALQALIASGEDPTTDLPETAAGTPTANQGDFGYVAVTRDGDETLADSGYDTTGQAAAPTAVTQEEALTENDSPSVLVNDAITVGEDQVASGNVLGNDTDADSDLSVVTFEVDGQTYPAGTEVTLEGGVLIINEDGSYTFTPNENWNGTVPVITYTTNTGVTATLTIEVTPVDDVSVLVNDSNTVAEDTVATGNVLDNDGDVDSDLSVVTFEVDGQTYPASTEVTLEGGVLIINEDGSYTFTPDENWNGTVPVITYTTNTGVTATLTIEITPVEDPTVTVNDVVTVSEDTPASGNVLDNDSDPDSDLSVVTFEVDGQTYPAGTEVTLEGGILIINEDGSYTFTPNENWNGTVPVITYTTNTGVTATLTIEVTPTNDAPTIDVVANDFTENSAVDGDVAATYTTFDEDGDALTVDFTPGSNTDGYYALVNGEVVLTQAGADLVNNGGTLPPVDLTVSDGSLTGQDSDTPVIAPTNDAPTIDVVANDFTENSAVDGDVAATYTTFDEDGDALTVDFTPGSNTDGYYALVNGEVVLTQAGADLVNNGGTLPPVDLTVSDGSLTGQDSDTPVIAPTNDAPTIDVVANDFTENSAVDGDVAATYTTFDEDGDALTVDFTPGSNDDGYYALVNGEVVLTQAGADLVNNGGTLPPVDLTVSDGSLTGQDSDTPGIAPTNDAPTIDVVANDFTENSAVDGDVAATYTTFDEDGDALTVDFTPGSNTDGYYALVNGEVVLTQAGADLVNNGGTLPAVDLTVSDGSLTGQDSDTPVIAPTNDAPTIDVVANDFTENSAVDGDVAATYTTFDEDGDALTVDFTPGSNTDGYYALVNGEVVLTQAGADLVNNGGTLPAVDLTVSDGSLTGQDSDTPVIAPTNDAPTIDVVANDFTENSAVDGDVAATYTTFDEDGDALTVDFTPGSNTDGYYALVNGEVVLTQAGADLVNNEGTLPPVDLTVSDGNLTGQDSDTPVITPINDTPVSDSYSFNYLENSTDSTVIGTVAATDPEGTPVTYSIVSGDSNGWFEIDPVTGIISLTPAGVAAVANDFEALANVHNLVVGASDGVNTTNINVTLTELDVNEGPEFTPPAGETSYSFNYLENSTDSTVIGTVAATDPEGTPVTYSIVSGDSNGWFEIDPVTGIISLTPAGVAAVAND